MLNMEEEDTFGRQYNQTLVVYTAVALHHKLQLLLSEAGKKRRQLIQVHIRWNHKHLNRPHYTDYLISADTSRL